MRPTFRPFLFLASALVGAALLAGPSPAAEAAEDTLTLDGPTEGEAVSSRTVTFAGGGTDGSTVNVLDPEGFRLSGTTAVVVSDGRWSITATFPAAAAPQQTVTVRQVTGGSGAGEEIVSFVLPDSDLLTVASPATGEELLSRTVTFSGTGETGSTITVHGSDGAPVPGSSPTTVTQGTWTVTALYPQDAARAQTATVDQVTAEGSRSQTVVTFQLPLVLLPAPAITSPATGATLSEKTFAITGTGQPGTVIVVFASPLIPSDVTDGPEDPVVVDGSGRWTRDVHLTPGSYRIVAGVAELDQAGRFVQVISEPSLPVLITLQESTGVTGAPDSRDAPHLANTGDNVGTLLPIGGLCALLGVALTLLLTGLKRLDTHR